MKRIDVYALARFLIFYGFMNKVIKFSFYPLAK